MTIETVKKIYNKEVEGYSENFGKRDRVIDISFAIKKMIYPDYMIVNRTEKPINYHGVTLAPRCNDFLLTSSEEQDLLRSSDKVQKLRFHVTDFATSEPFEIGKTGACIVRELDVTQTASKPHRKPKRTEKRPEKYQ